jgi:hypothetical protein
MIEHLLPAVHDPSCPEAFWLKLIPKTQDRNIILGYLSIRKKQDPMEAVKSEQRMQAFRVVKEALMELQDLQLKKAELERGSTVLNRKESVRQDIENILDKIDDTKQKLELAQRSIQQQDDKGPKGRPHSAFANRMRSKISTSNRDAASTTAPKSPRVDNESPTRRRHIHNDEAQETVQPPRERPWSARSPGAAKPSLNRSGSAFKQPRSNLSSSTSAAAPEVPDDPFVGTCFSSVRFKAATGHDEIAAPTASLRSKQLDIGPGWNRNTPIPRMRQWATRATTSRFGVSAGGAPSGHEAFAFQSSLGDHATSDTKQATPRPGSSIIRPPPGFDANFTVRGLKATSVALGVNLENDHYAQMCCGATTTEL